MQLACLSDRYQGERNDGVVAVSAFRNRYSCVYVCISGFALGIEQTARWCKGGERVI